MVERCVRAVYRLDRVALEGVGPRRGSAGAVVEVDRGDLLAVHRAVGAVFLDVEETVVGAVLVLPGVFIAAGTGADLDVLQRVELLEDRAACGIDDHQRSEEHTSELQSLMRISYAVFCLKKKKTHRKTKNKETEQK